MRVTLYGLLIKARENKGKAYGALLQGERVIEFYAKDARAVADILRLSQEHLAPVSITGRVYAGTDFGTGAPNGKVTLVADAVEASEIGASLNTAS